MQLRALVIAAVVGCLALPAAWAAPPMHVRGTIETFDGHALTVKTREGPVLTMALAPHLRIGYHVKKTLADIKPGDFVASTGVRGADGKIHAIEVRIFPESLRGAGEGQYPWDLKPDSIMTNATVTGTATVAAGHVLKVRYKGGESQYVVGPECPIYGYVPGDTSLLKPGKAVFALAKKDSDGSLTALFIAVEKNGIKPPM